MKPSNGTFVPIQIFWLQKWPNFQNGQKYRRPDKIAILGSGFHGGFLVSKSYGKSIETRRIETNRLQIQITLVFPKLTKGYCNIVRQNKVNLKNKNTDYCTRAERKKKKTQLVTFHCFPHLANDEAECLDARMLKELEWCQQSRQQLQKRPRRRNYIVL